MSGGAASGRKGSAYERELVQRFDAARWGCLRLPSSGSATKRDLPDVLAGKAAPNPYCVVENGDIGVEIRHDNSDLLAVELKSGKATTLYVEQDEVDALETFARTWGARPFLGARFTTRGSGTETYLVPPDDARGPTDAGAYGLPVADIEERAAVVVSDDGVER